MAFADDIERLKRAVEQARRLLLAQLAERGMQLLRSEVPYVTGNLRQGVGAPVINYERGTAVLTVTARSAAQGVRTAEAYNARGQKTGTVTLRPTRSFNYAAAVARGRGPIRPKRAKALLIPVPAGPIKGGYLIIGGQRFIVRPRARASKPNPFDQRSARRLSQDAVPIAEAVLRRAFS